VIGAFERLIAEMEKDEFASEFADGVAAAIEGLERDADVCSNCLGIRDRILDIVKARAPLRDRFAQIAGLGLGRPRQHDAVRHE